MSTEESLDLTGYLNPWETLGTTRAPNFYKGLFDTLYGTQAGTDFTKPPGVTDTIDPTTGETIYGQVAGFDPMQTQAFQRMQDFTTQGQYQPVVNEDGSVNYERVTQGGTGAYLAEQVADQYGQGIDMGYAEDIANNPYMDTMIDAALRDPYRQYSEVDRPAVEQAAAMIGDSSRTDLARGGVQRGYEDRAADIAAQMRGGAYQTGLQMAENKIVQDQNLAQLGTQLGLNNINTMMTGGGMQQDLQQQIRNANMGNFAYGEDRPWQLANNLNTLMFPALSGFGKTYGTGAPDIMDKFMAGLAGSISSGLGSGLTDWFSDNVLNR